MPSPRVTLVTPVYNQAEYLAATIESVLAQDYAALEYLVIDDGSSDDSLAVARRYEQSHPGRLRVIAQANIGQAATLNKGWAMATGEILAYLSSDDCLLPGAIGRMVEALQSHPRAAVAYCDFWLIDAQGGRLREVRTEDFDADRLRVDLVCQPGPGAFFRREVFTRQGGWRAELRQVPDFEFWLRASREGDFIRVPQALAEYRIHEGSASFRAMPPARAEEIVGVVQACWAAEPETGRARLALAKALGIAAKNHGQSGRLVDALRTFARALRLKPSMAADLGIWRQLIVGIVRRRWYQWRAATGGA
ncbi:glycosyltransferase family 2 protein [Pelomonas sp. APW6]|uniref:Glycosyltransferase family 2 protein n=1 Tax=Roseateles subflavus TaxID=3053353 RepID=A0ABT7LJ51_9BURK|nr:glycosyltransferase family 2 protein [Pelomonas sp. APW6]MDL5032884.1 glycosyltransferase family 2 protein [Pelomonas sp. APW6]